MRQVLTSITIAAPPHRVWHILTDFQAYSQWNPFMPSVLGSPEVGRKLAVRLQPPGGKTVTFKPTVLTANPNQEFRWRGRLIVPGLFDGEHHFLLSPAEEGTLLNHGERFSGLIVHLLPASVFEQTERGFIAMNNALKERAEA